MICKICKSNNISKYGKTKQGKQRYICNDCKKVFLGFYEKKIIIRTVDKTCPYCSSKEISKAGILPSGKQRYLCRSCNHSFNDDTVVNIKKVCPYCNSENTIKSGKTGITQRYDCKDCGRGFSENTENKLRNKANKMRRIILTLDDKKFISLYHFRLGISAKELAKTLDKDVKVVNKYISEFKPITQTKKYKKTSKIIEARIAKINNCGLGWTP